MRKEQLINRDVKNLKQLCKDNNIEKCNRLRKKDKIIEIMVEEFEKIRLDKINKDIKKESLEFKINERILNLNNQFQERERLRNNSSTKGKIEYNDGHVRYYISQKLEKIRKKVHEKHYQNGSHTEIDFSENNISDQLFNYNYNTEYSYEFLKDFWNAIKSFK